MADDVTIKVDPPIGSILERVKARVTGGFRRGILKAAEYAAGELRREVQATFDQRTGKLGRSFRATLLEDGETITAGAFSDLVYARILDEGGTVTPKSRKYLAVPIPGSRAARTVGLWPRHWGAGELVGFKSRAGNIILAQRKGKGKRAQLLPQYVLKRSVTIGGRGYIRAAEASVRKVLADILAEEMGGDE